MENMRNLLIIAWLGGGAVIWLLGWFAVRSERAARAQAGQRPETAGLMIRMTAKLADLLVVWVLIALIVTAGAALEALRVAGPAIWMMVMALIVTAFLLYFTLPTASSGQTWGKRLAGLTVARGPGELLGLWRALIRALVDAAFLWLLQFLVGILNPLFVVTTRKNRGIHDFAAGSRVYRTAQSPSGILPYAAMLAWFAPLVLVGFAINMFVASSYFVPNNSMSPALQGPDTENNRPPDNFLVNKLSYRIGTPQRGDVIVFAAPPQARVSIGETEPRAPSSLTKRVIGLPGDGIRIAAEEGVFVNGGRFGDDYFAQFPAYDWPVGEMGQTTAEPYVVPAGHLFVLGDNLNESYDSHLWRDPETREPAPGLPLENVIGRATVVLSPTNRAGPIE